LGLDKARLAAAFDTLSNIHPVLENYIPPLLPGFFPRADTQLSYPDAARLLLDRFLPGNGRKGLTLALLLPAPRTDPLARFGRELERQLGGLEIKLEVKYLRNPEDALDVRVPYLKFLEYSMDFPDPENILVPLFHSRSVVGLLNSRYGDLQLDALLERSEIEPSWERRADLFRMAEKILFKDTPAIPLFSERIRLSLLPKVRGVRLPASGFIFLDAKDIWLAN